jgi:anti-anti-sigma factor
MSLVSLAVERHPDGVRVALSGEVDASNAEEVRIGVEDAISEPTLVLDLTRLDYVDSAGIRALFAVSECAAARGCRCRIVVGEDTPVRRVLDVAGISSAFQIDGSGPM